MKLCIELYVKNPHVLDTLREVIYLPSNRAIRLVKRKCAITTSIEDTYCLQPNDNYVDFYILFNLKDITGIREDNLLAGTPTCLSHAWKKPKRITSSQRITGKGLLIVLDEMTIQVRDTLLFKKKEVNNVPEITW